MPRVLRKLRIDEISCVDSAANGGAKVVLMKRDVPGFYHKLFASAPVRKAATYRGGSERRLHHIEGLTRSEAIHWLAHSASGRSFASGRGESLSDLADLLIEASQRPSEVEKRKDTLEASSINKEENPMSEHFDIVTFSKRVVNDGVSAISEAQATELVQKYCNLHRQAGEKPAVAFARIFGGDDDVGVAYPARTLTSGHA